MNRSRSLAALLCAGLLASCGKEAVQILAADPPAARIKFYNYGVCGTTPTATTSCMPAVNFYANATKMTAVSSTTADVESTNGTVYGGVGNGGLYSSIAPGQYIFSGKITATADKDRVVSNIPGTIADGKYYSVFQSGFYDATAKTIDGFVVEDAIALPPDNVSTYVRFVNAIANSSPMTLYVKHTTTGQEIAIGGDVAYKGASSFVLIPNGTYDVSTRVAGSSTNVIARTGVGLGGPKASTLAARGDVTIVSTTAINRPVLDLTQGF